MRLRTRFMATLATLVLAGCAGNGDGLDANGRPLDSGGPGDGPLVATFESIQAHVFTPICATCHAGAAAPQGLRLDAASSFDLLVGVGSNEVPSLQRVQPGDPDRSYLVQKLEGRAAVGARMPLGGPYLDAATLEVVRQWIRDGALRATSTADPSQSFALAFSAPGDGERVLPATRQLVLAFTRDLDVTRLDGASVHLDRLDANGNVVAAVPVRAEVPSGNPRAVVVTPRATLTAGRYALLVEDAALADLAGHPLATAASAMRAGVHIVFEVEDAR